MLLILAFDRAIFSRRSPDFHRSLKPGFFLRRFELIEFSHSSRSRIILRIVRATQEREAKSRVLFQLLQVGVELVLIQ